MIHKLKLKINTIHEIRYNKLSWTAFDILHSRPELFLAGGKLASILNFTKSEDLDFFYLGPETLGDYVQKIRTIPALNFMEIEQWTPEVVTFKKNAQKIQFIKIEGSTTPEAILEGFDMVQCMIGMKWNPVEDELEMFSDRRTLKAILQKKIIFNKVEYPLVAFKRFLKYHKKGYTASDDEMRKFLEQIHVRLLTYNLTDDSISQESLWREYLRH